MATNDDLDDFFKKKDRKGNKHKKQTISLTNNEELLKQLVIVTSATSAFKENMNFDDEDDEQQINPESIVGTGFSEDTHKNPTHHHKTKVQDDNKYSNGQQTITSVEGEQQQQQQQQTDEWEEFIDPNLKYKELRLKLSRGNNDDNNEDEYYDDEDNPNNNDDNTERNIDREQQKDKPVWKIDQVKQQTEATVPIVEEKIEESTPKPSTTTTAAYRPPQLRTGGAGVTVVSGVSQRPTKKEKPNLASTDEFPTLGSTVNKK